MHLSRRALLNEIWKCSIYGSPGKYCGLVAFFWIQPTVAPFLCSHCFAWRMTYVGNWNKEAGFGGMPPTNMRSCTLFIIQQSTHIIHSEHLINVISKVSIFTLTCSSREIAWDREGEQRVLVLGNDKICNPYWFQLKRNMIYSSVNCKIKNLPLILTPSPIPTSTLNLTLASNLRKWFFPKT